MNQNNDFKIAENPVHEMTVYSAVLQFVLPTPRIKSSKKFRS